VQQIYEILSSQNGKNETLVFLDTECLNYGQNWERAVLNGLRSSRVIILLISSKTFEVIVDSAEQQKQSNLLVEYECALLQNKLRGIPVFPIFLSDVNYLQFPNIPHARGNKVQREIDNLSSSLPSEEIEFLETVSKTMDEISKLRGHSLFSRAEDKAELDRMVALLMRVQNKHEGFR